MQESVPSGQKTKRQFSRDWPNFDLCVGRLVIHKLIHQSTRLQPSCWDFHKRLVLPAIRTEIQCHSGKDSPVHLECVCGGIVSFFHSTHRWNNKKNNQCLTRLTDCTQFSSSSMTRRSTPQIPTCACVSTSLLAKGSQTFYGPVHYRQIGGQYHFHSHPHNLVYS